MPALNVKRYSNTIFLSFPIFHFWRADSFIPKQPNSLDLSSGFSCFIKCTVSLNTHHTHSHILINIKRIYIKFHPKLKFIRVVRRLTMTNLIAIHSSFNKINRTKASFSQIKTELIIYDITILGMWYLIFNWGNLLTTMLALFIN